MGNHERLFIADDMDFVRGGLNTYFEFTDHEVVAEAKNMEEIEMVLGDESVDFTVAIIDNSMPNEGDGTKAAELIREKRPGVKIIALSTEQRSYGDVYVDKMAGAQAIHKAVDEI